MIIGVVSQKGGVGKSTLIRLLAREYAINKWIVKIADMDAKQGTVTRWNMCRNDMKINPSIKTEQYRAVKDAMNDYNKGEIDLLLFDGAPAASITTLQIANNSNLIVLPTGISIDDLEPTVRLAHELVKQGILKRRIAIVLSRVGDSDAELLDARAYIEQTGYKTLQSSLPDRVAYRRAQDSGKSIAETSFKTLNKRAVEIAQEIVNLTTEVTKHKD
jgi:chromosome partitioning protein